MHQCDNMVYFELKFISLFFLNKLARKLATAIHNLKWLDIFIFTANMANVPIL